MENNNDFSIDDELISKVGLILSDKPINDQISPHSRVFQYPFLENVFVMEVDLYGNIMPRDSCFLAFYGQHGLIGKHLYIETLKNSSVDDIKEIVESHLQG